MMSPVYEAINRLRFIVSLDFKTAALAWRDLWMETGVWEALTRTISFGLPLGLIQESLLIIAQVH
jgi:hypothetical protein